MSSFSGISVVTQHQLENEPRQRTTYSAEYVRSMFDSIAHRYDLLNHVLSSGLDVLWRHKMVRLLRPYRPQSVLDLATGTADVALEVARQLKPSQIVGIDIAERMLEIGKRKIARAGFSRVISLEIGNAARLRFASASFDCATVAFGIRNFEHPEQCLGEMFRVLRPSGVMAILEFSRPTVFPVKQLYQAYSQFVLPAVGRWISRNSSAYSYLPATIAEFPDGNSFGALLSEAGFRSVRQVPLAFGIATIYLAEK